RRNLWGISTCEGDVYATRVRFFALAPGRRPTKFEERMVTSMEEFSKKMDGLEAMMEKTFKKLSGFESWRSSADEAFGALLAQTEAVKSHLERLETAPSPPPPPPPQQHWGPPPPPFQFCDPFDVPPRHQQSRAQAGGQGPLNLNLPPPGSLRPPASGVEHAPGHRHERYHRDVGGGILGPHPPHPVTGTSIPYQQHIPEHGDSFHEVVSHRSSFLPKMEFPKFDGDNPRLWWDRCEMYFEVYAVADSLKTRFAALNFSGAAATWLQTVEHKGRVHDWDLLCKLVFSRFDRDQYQLQLRQLDSLRQSGSVAEYLGQFEQLSHGVLLYNLSYDDTYFVTRFLGGLKEEIRSAIALHRPQDVETASALALLQEEQLDQSRKRPLGRDFTKFVPRATVPVDKPKVPPAEKPKPRADWEEKFDNLKLHRKKNGLCFKCEEKWGHGHKCPASVPIHVIEELLEVMDVEDSIDLPSEETLDEEEETVMVVDSASVPSSLKRKTMRLHGKIGSRDILVLVDSGSVGTFISASLASQLEYKPQSCVQTQYVAADGSPMLCSQHIPYLQWWCQGHTFTSDVGILPLQCFDMIVGEDWLENCSPMWVDWRKKVMKFTHQGRRITLYGVRPAVTKCSAIGAGKLKGLLRRKAITHCVQLSQSTLDIADNVSAISMESSELLQAVPLEVREVLQKFDHLFQEPTELPPTRQYDHRIDLIPGAQPIQSRPYRYAPVQKTEIERQLTEMLRNGIIRSSCSPYASPVLLVKKKDGTWRFCVDYRKLNAITVKNKHPLPIVEELIDELASAQWFSKLDFRSGYHQIRIAKGDEHKTAFKTHSGLYEFLVMPFGLTNAPATFQSVMNTIFGKWLRHGVLVFMDDILIYTATLHEHIQLLTEVLSIIGKHQFCIKLSKCSFAQREIEYLGHCISAKGVATEPSKVRAVQEWPVPATLKELRGFLGLTGYYRKFIRNYGMIARPLTQLLKKGVAFQWTSVTDEAFQLLKKAMIEAPVLAIPDFSKPFVIETDASDFGLGAVLMQEGHPVAYLSKHLSERNSGLSTYEKECMAILMAVEKWRPYLQNGEFILRTDHKNLLYLTEQRASTKLQLKAVLKLMDLRYKIVYKKGCTNVAADALSRCPRSASVVAVSECTPAWLERVVAGYEDDTVSKQLLTELSISSPNSRGFSLLNGFHVTYHRIKGLFAWPKMKDDIRQFVQSCSVCQQAKGEHVRTPGLLEPLPVPYQPWATVSLDFVEGLPQSGRFNAILVVVDKLTKYGHFIPLAHPFTALQVAQLYMDNVYKLHGLPQQIISDRDKIFTSKLWQELFRLSDTQLIMSSSYHPQTDGQTERLNQCLEAFLRCSVHSCPTQWHKWIPLAEYWYNTALHSSLDRSPFEVLYGHLPRHFSIVHPSASSVPDLDSWLQERDRVYLKIQPYIQTSVAWRSNQKLAFKYFGPFTVLQKVGNVAYKLDLPPNCRIHNVVHVSQLKQYVPAHEEVIPNISSLPFDPEAVLQPVAALDHRVVTIGSSSVSQLKIQWSQLPPGLATWEEEHDLFRRFRDAPVWGQPGFRGGGSVMAKRREELKSELRNGLAE
ncbi:hypothetical protein U9M48_042044, partial [Paspalum notatum var. saurae]